MFPLIVLLFCSLLTANVWFFLFRPQRPWEAKVGAILKILAFYTFAFTVFAQTGIVPEHLVDEVVVLCSAELIGHELRQIHFGGLLTSRFFLHIFLEALP